ncbi:alpha/beta hydrolase family protein [Tengunoibacter tsumagoiensis]|uniref:AB hydrolase-1 domain-containing protein n=1 Tax=Tengunoibacter tsumagoiensis TaxID=2014871 RepID=A0A402A6Q8_9CHLR|nr:prolyl oligopeptidase family serine peptidase [Tengunoibacter tsumagoiensis]GCE14808.1 hypothetical protein KTT_46670 [Tengunoibacter tsumagoiensis]
MMLNGTFNYTFKEEDVRYSSGDLSLAGTLLLPETDRSCPAVVCVHGSGPETRSSTRHIGELFAEKGIAALIYDKRGTGSSMGNWFKDYWSYRELANDALAGVQFLKSRPEIDASQIGLWGLSEGGWVAPLAAASSLDVAFLITASAAGMSPLQQESYRRGLIDRASPSAWKRLWRRSMTRLLFALVAFPPLKLLPGITGFSARTFDYDPVPVWKNIKQPVLALWSDEDTCVPPRESAAIIEKALQEGGNRAYTLYTFPHGDHCFYYSQENAAGQMVWDLVPGYSEMMTNWVNYRGERNIALSVL